MTAFIYSECCPDCPPVVPWAPEDIAEVEARIEAQVMAEIRRMHLPESAVSILFDVAGA